MAEEHAKPAEQQYKTDNLDLAAFLITRSCRLAKHEVKSDDRAEFLTRLEFTLSGDDLFKLVDEFDSHAACLVKVHDFTAAQKFLKDLCGKAKREHKSGQRRS